MVKKKTFNEFNIEGMYLNLIKPYKTTTQLILHSVVKG